MAKIQGRIDPDGVIINVTIMLGSNDEATRKTGGALIPQPFPTIGILDTASTRTIIHPFISHHFGLVSADRIPLTMPGQRTVDVPVFKVGFGWGHPPLRKPAFDIEALSYVPASNVFVIIGRDVLERATVIYYGPGKAFSLRF